MDEKFSMKIFQEPSALTRRCPRPPSIVLWTVDVDQTGFRKRLAHLVHVEAKRAGLQLLAFSVFVVLALLRLLRGLDGNFLRNHDDAIVVRNHDIAGLNVDAGADDRDVDRAK